MHILLVEDDPVNSIALAETLRAQGHAVDIASDGYEALEVIRANKFDAIISDAFTPRMDGYVLCRTIRADEAHKNLPVILLTAEYAGIADQQFAMNVGATRILSRTTSPEDLMRTLGNLDDTRSDSGGMLEDVHLLDEGQRLKGSVSTLPEGLVARVSELERVNRELLKRNVDLEREKRKYHKLLTSANDGILVVDQRTNGIVESNTRARKALNLTNKTISQKKLHDLRPFGALLAEKTSRGEATQFESYYESGATRIILSVSGTPVGPDDNLYLIILRDVTRRRDWLERFITLDKLRALGRLSRGMVHEIRNPLNVVSVNLQYLDRSAGEDSAEKKFTKPALQGVNAIEKVIRETMNFAQPSNPAKAQVKLGSLLGELAALSRTSLLKSKIKLSVEKGEAKDTIFADKSQVLHGLLNIVENAIEAMPNGGTLQFKLEDSGKDEDVVLRITDSGVGMDENVAKLAVEPFYTTREGAIGMGLSVANRLFELNDARLSLESQTGVGTTFTIRFYRRRPV